MKCPWIRPEFWTRACLESLGLNPLVDAEEERLLIVDAGNMSRLLPIMQVIYEEACYNMHYWKDSQSYRFEVRFAELINAIQDRKLLSFLGGQATYESYREAFAQLITPQNKEEADFSTGADETLGMMSSVFSIADDISEVFMNEAGVDLMGSLKDTYENVSRLMEILTSGNELLDGEDQLELLAYFQAARETEETIIRALKDIAPKTSGIDSKMEAALDQVMDTYVDQGALWLRVIDYLVDQSTDVSFGAIDHLLGNVLPQSYLLDIANELINFYLGTGDQASATVQASRFLDVQTCCQQVFEELWPQYESASVEKKDKLLRSMYDVTNLYLRAGLKAQEAMSEVDDMKAATNYSIKRLKEEQMRMAQFTEMDLHLLWNCYNAMSWLIALKNTPSAEALEIIQPTPVDSLPDMPVYVTITWKNKVGNTQIHMTANITGALDDGANVHRAGSEGEYVSRSGRVASHSDYGKWIDLEILRTDGVLDVIVMYDARMPYGSPSYAQANVDIHIYNPLGTIAVIAANPTESSFAESPYMVALDDYLNNEADGIGIFTFRLDHGVLKSLKPKGDDTQLEEQYTPDGQLQSSELYNADGYMLESRWYDNGECTAYTIWTYNEHNHLTRIRYANQVEPDEIQLIFENVYSDGVLQEVHLYNAFGMLLGDGPTAADAADAVGMRMIVEESLPEK